MVSAINLKYWGPTLDDLERLIGPLHEAPVPFSAFEALEGEYRGCPVRAIWLKVGGSGGPRGSSLQLATSIDDRPIRTYVWRRKGSSISGPKATTGDAAFDKMYIASARPPEVVNAAFDAEVRAMIRRRWPDADTTLDVKEGWVRMGAGSSTRGLHGQRPAPLADDLVPILDDVLLVADKLKAAYDDRRAAIANTDGAAAAAAWEQACRDDIVKNRRARRATLFAILLAVAGAITAISMVRF